MTRLAHDNACVYGQGHHDHCTSEPACLEVVTIDNNQLHHNAPLTWDANRPCPIKALKMCFPMAAKERQKTTQKASDTHLSKKTTASTPFTSVFSLQPRSKYPLHRFPPPLSPLPLLPPPLSPLPLLVPSPPPLHRSQEKRGWWQFQEMSALRVILAADRLA